MCLHLSLLRQDRNYHCHPETGYHCVILVPLGESAARLLGLCLQSGDSADSTGRVSHCSGFTGSRCWEGTSKGTEDKLTFCH